MVFKTPSWMPPVSMEPPDSIPISDFMLDEKWGRQPIQRSRPPFTCGLSGAEYSMSETKDRVYSLARGISKELGWKPNQGTEWDKVICVFSANAVRTTHVRFSMKQAANDVLRQKIDTLTLSWAVHSLSGISSPANAAYSEAELLFQLKSSGAKALFTCLPLLSISYAAARKAGIPRNHIYLLPLPKEATGDIPMPKDVKTVDQLIQDGANLPPLEPLNWSKGQGARQTAFLCYSSGTSGLPVCKMMV